MENPTYSPNLHFIDAQGRRVGSDDADYEQPLAVVHKFIAKEVAEHRVFTSAYEIELPEEAHDVTKKVQNFLGTFGLKNTASIHMISPEGRKVKEGEYQGEYNAIPDALYLYADTIEEAANNYGSMTMVLGAVISHELAHASKPTEEFGLSLYPPDSQAKWIRRSGFNIFKPDGQMVGQFYEEAFAEYCSGLWVRRENDPDAGLLSFDATKSPALIVPEYYRTGTQIAGPDGYSLELMAYGVENAGIMPAEAFIDSFFASRNDETSTQGLRTVARSINQLSPGLYTELRSLEYFQENWKRGLERVHDAVTK